MNINYFANQIYQFSYTLPIYRKLGGKFILKSIKRYIQLKRHLKDTNKDPNVKNFMNTPPVKIVRMKRVAKLDGIVISASNAPIHSDKKKCITIFIGHGTGDKKYGPNSEYLEKYEQDLYEQYPCHLKHSSDLLERYPSEESNLDYPFYENF